MFYCACNWKSLLLWPWSADISGFAASPACVDNHRICDAKWKMQSPNSNYIELDAKILQHKRTVLLITAFLLCFAPFLCSESSV